MIQKKTYLTPIQEEVSPLESPFQTIQETLLNATKILQREEGNCSPCNCQTHIFEPLTSLFSALKKELELLENTLTTILTRAEKSSKQKDTTSKMLMDMLQEMELSLRFLQKKQESQPKESKLIRTLENDLSGLSQEFLLQEEQLQTLKQKNNKLKEMIDSLTSDLDKAKESSEDKDKLIKSQKTTLKQNSTTMSKLSQEKKDLNNQVLHKSTELQKLKTVAFITTTLLIAATALLVIQQKS